MLASVIDGILSDDDEGPGSGEEGSDGPAGSEEEGSEDEEEEEDEEALGSSEEEGEGSDEEEEGGGSDEEGAAEAQPAAGPADPFSRKQLQQKAAAAAAAQEGDAQQQPARPPPEEGATVFIRGLPLDVSKEQVFLKMKVRRCWGAGRAGAGLGGMFAGCFGGACCCGGIGMRIRVHVVLACAHSPQFPRGGCLWGESVCQPWRAHGACGGGAIVLYLMQVCTAWAALFSLAALP